MKPFYDHTARWMGEEKESAPDMFFLGKNPPRPFFSWHVDWGWTLRAALVGCIFFTALYFTTQQPVEDHEGAIFTSMSDGRSMER